MSPHKGLGTFFSQSNLVRYELEFTAVIVLLGLGNDKL